MMWLPQGSHQRYQHPNSRFIAFSRSARPASFYSRRALRLSTLSVSYVRRVIGAFATEGMRSQVRAVGFDEQAIAGNCFGNRPYRHS